jgi:hypothetical protein
MALNQNPECGSVSLGNALHKRVVLSRVRRRREQSSFHGLIVASTQHGEFPVVAV